MFSLTKVELFWMRAVKDPDFTRIFCLVHAEKLSYKVSNKVLQSLDEHTQGKNGTHCIISCDNLSLLSIIHKHNVSKAELILYDSTHE